MAVTLSMSGITLAQIGQLLDEKLKPIDNRLTSLEEEFKKVDRKLNDIETFNQKVDRKLKDLESDSRTDKAMLRAARQMGFGFHEKTPYELQGNAAIEDIKEYY